MTSPPPHASLDDALDSGDLAAAYTLACALLTAPDAQPGHHLLVAILAAQLERFPDAIAHLETLASAHPSWRRQTQELSLCLGLSQDLAARLSDPDAVDRVALEPPPDFARAYLDATVAFAEGRFADASALLRDLHRPTNQGRMVLTSGRIIVFDDLYDPDTLTGVMLVASGPRCVIDVPWVSIRSLVLQPPVAFHDHLWPVASLQTHAGKSLMVRLSGRYPGTGLHPDAAVRTAQRTEWTEHDGILVGAGARALRVARHDGQSEDVVLSLIARIDL